MKYAMVIIQSDHDSVEELSTAEQEFDPLVRWWADLRAGGKLVASARLAPSRSTTTVSWSGEGPIVTDGPYIEAKESVGGFLVVEVDSAAEAVEMASSWPHRAGTRIEVRPIVER